MSSFVIEKIINPPSLSRTKNKSYRLSSVLLGLYIFVYGYRYYKYNKKPEKGDYAVGGLMALGWLGGL